jgi:hypothetical protein
MQFVSCEASQEIPFSPFDVQFSYLYITVGNVVISSCFSCVVWVLLAEVFFGLLHTFADAAWLT